MTVSVSGEGGGVNLGLIITPMLDMAFQLLAFFVMTYHPNALEGHIDGKLLPPQQKALKGDAPKDTKSPAPTPEDDQDPDVNDMVYVVIKAVPKGQAEGNLSEGAPTRLQLRRAEGGAGAETVAEVTQADLDHPEYFGSAVKKLSAELEKIRKSPTGDQTTISIEADPDLKQGYLVQVYDACKTAGFKSVGFVPPPTEVQGR
jgi:biopolymer transport protein ExbD